VSRYASNSSVSVAQSRAEIEALISKYGAEQFFSAWDNTGRAIIGWTMEGRQVRIAVPLPVPTDPKFTKVDRGIRYESWHDRSPEAARKLWEQACRARWRAVTLVVKAKLEAVAIGLSTFESEFLSNIVLPDGSTVGQVMQPQLEAAYRSGKMPPLLPRNE
jgi:hypothetical protein